MSSVSLFFIKVAVVPLSFSFKASPLTISVTLSKDEQFTKKCKTSYDLFFTYDFERKKKHDVT